MAAAPKLVLKGNNVIPGRTEELGFPGRREIKKRFSATRREQTQRLKQPALRLKALRTELVAGSLRPTLQDSDSSESKSSTAKKDPGTKAKVRKEAHTVSRKPVKKAAKKLETAK